MERPTSRLGTSTLTTLTVACLALAGHVSSAQDGLTSPHPDIRVELFAEDPLVVTPNGIAVDKQGRVFVAESHTHFRPDDYEGPQADRILLMDDTDGDGRADRSQVFHEGFKHLMDLEFAPDGSLYVATRMDIHRLIDTNQDGVADLVQPIVVMETEGAYPHNGVSGLCFNADGSLNFGLGENLGHAYTLIGTDGTKVSGGGEGGSTYRVRADGGQLRRVTTGWWNPFGMCVDRYGRIFGTDNDPGESPPCRLIQIHPGADYGYEYRYGRSGLHPLISWQGELPGNIPMIAGTGEAPCGILPAEGTSLPAQFEGDLLVASWADHRIERYEVSQPSDVGQVRAARHTLIQGPQDFRPVGLAIAPDGSIYVSDWVLANYELHGRGRIWRIRGASTPTESPFPGILRQDSGVLKDWLTKATNLEERVAVVTELLQRGDGTPDVWAQPGQPTPVRALAIRDLAVEEHADLILSAANESDPVIRHAAIDVLSSQAESAAFKDNVSQLSASVLLAMKRSQHRAEYGKSETLAEALNDPMSSAWGVAVKWIADDQLIQHRERLAKELERTTLTNQEFLMVTAALDRLDGKKPADQPPPKLLAKMATDESNSLALRSASLRLLGSNSDAVSVATLLKLIDEPANRIRLESIRLLAGRSGGVATDQLVRIVRNASESPSVRCESLITLSTSKVDATNKAGDSKLIELMVELAEDPADSVASTALQCLVGRPLDSEQRERVQSVQRRDALHESVQRVLMELPARPDASDTDAWMQLLDREAQRRPGNVDAGERVYFHQQIGTCGKCHRHSGRGTAIGPSLSVIARGLPTERRAATRQLLETILQPGKDMAPQYTPWKIVTVDGKVLIGLPRRKGGSHEAYLGLNGEEFSVKKRDIEFHQESRTSIMPTGLLQQLTVAEIHDLFTFLLASHGQQSR